MKPQSEQGEEKRAATMEAAAEMIIMKKQDIKQWESALDTLQQERDAAMSLAKLAKQTNMSRDVQRQLQTVKRLDDQIAQVEGHLQRVQEQLFALEDVPLQIQMVRELQKGTDDLNRLTEELGIAKAEAVVEDAQQAVRTAKESDRVFQNVGATYRDEMEDEDEEDLLAELEEDDINTLSNYIPEVLPNSANAHSNVTQNNVPTPTPSTATFKQHAQTDNPENKPIHRSDSDAELAALERDFSKMATKQEIRPVTAEDAELDRLQAELNGH